MLDSITEPIKGKWIEDFDYTCNYYKWNIFEFLRSMGNVNPLQCLPRATSDTILTAYLDWIQSSDKIKEQVTKFEKKILTASTFWQTATNTILIILSNSCKNVSIPLFWIRINLQTLIERQQVLDQIMKETYDEGSKLVNSIEYFDYEIL